MVYVVLGILVLVAIYFFITYNSLINLKNLVKEAFSTMDIYLKKRWDLIPNLVEIVKQYAKYESDTLKELTELRASAYDELKNENKIDVNLKLNQSLSKILMISENYPELKANESFSKLSENLTQVEDEIANSRKYYNGTVKMLNNKIQMFPSNIIANLTGFKEEKMFEVSNIEEKKNVKIDL